jgi:aerobic-type carbon monoxide dehydrogenase small subunit (CoxS/CutS family)
MIKLRIDGRPYQLPVPPGTPLLQVIQQQLRTLSSPPAQESGPPRDL